METNEEAQSKRKGRLRRGGIVTAFFGFLIFGSTVLWKPIKLEGGCAKVKYTVPEKRICGQELPPSEIQNLYVYSFVNLDDDEQAKLQALVAEVKDYSCANPPSEEASLANQSNMLITLADLDPDMVYSRAVTDSTEFELCDHEYPISLGDIFPHFKVTLDLVSFTVDTDGSWSYPSLIATKDFYAFVGVLNK